MGVRCRLLGVGCGLDVLELRQSVVPLQQCCKLAGRGAEWVVFHREDGQRRILCQRCNQRAQLDTAGHLQRTQPWVAARDTFQQCHDYNTDRPSTRPARRIADLSGATTYSASELEGSSSFGFLLSLGMDADGAGAKGFGHIPLSTVSCSSHCISAVASPRGRTGLVATSAVMWAERGGIVHGVKR